MTITIALDTARAESRLAPADCTATV